MHHFKQGVIARNVTHEQSQRSAAWSKRLEFICGHFVLANEPAETTALFACEPRSKTDVATCTRQQLGYIGALECRDRTLFGLAKPQISQD